MTLQNYLRDTNRIHFAGSWPVFRAQKKARTLPTGPWKFWERMPERQLLYAAGRPIVQVRNDQTKVAIDAIIVARYRTTPGNSPKIL